MVPTDASRRTLPGYLDLTSELNALPFAASIERVANNSLGSYGMYFEAYARTRSAPFDFYLFSEDDYIPTRAHYDALLVRMHAASFGASGRGVLVGILQGRPVEPLSKYDLHAESSHVMSAGTLDAIFEHVYAQHRWKGSMASAALAMLARERLLKARGHGQRADGRGSRRARLPALSVRRAARLFHRNGSALSPSSYGYYDLLQLAFGSLMRDVGVPMRDWTSAFRTPYWNHDELVDWSGAAHLWSVPPERVLFAPVQWLYAHHARQCCGRLNCLDAEMRARVPAHARRS